MEWNRAKQFVIVILILLNAVLAFLNYKEHQNNVLTSSQEKAIFEVLSQNGISLYTELLKEFPPMRKLQLRIPSYSRDDMKQMFFPNEETSVTVEFDKTIIKCPTKILTMQGNQGTLVFPKGTEKLEQLNQETATKEAEKFMSDLSRQFRHFQLGRVTETETGYTVEYFEKYKGTLIFASHFVIHITMDGITSVDLTYYKPEGFVGDKKDICFADEALLTFMKEIRKVEPTATITIHKMELGYDFQDYGVEATDTREKLVPCYRIYIMGKEEPYIINAYTNELIAEQQIQME